MEDLKITGRLVILDDSKSQINSSQTLQILAYKLGIKSIKLFKRDYLKNMDRPNDDKFEITDTEVDKYLTLEYLEKRRKNVT